MGELEFRTVGFGAEAMEYDAAWQLQRTVHQGVVDGGADTVLLLEHPPVFTAGKRTDPHERPIGGRATGVPVIDVDRGGKITFHGPGQLVGYPIVRLPDHVYVVDYVRRLEEALIRTCADLGLTTARVPGRSGVWVPADPERSEPGLRDDGTRGGAPRAEDVGGSTVGGAPRAERKVAAIGIRVSQGVAMHGFALNCDIDLGWYDTFVPCGISDAGVTSLSAELGRDVTVAEVAPVAEKHLRALLDWTPYERTPDLPAKPEPGRAPRLIDPAAALR